VLYIQCQYTQLMMVCCVMAVKRMGMLGVSVKKTKALTLKEQCMKLVVKLFFYREFYFWGVVLDLDKCIFPWQTCFVCGGHLRLESSCIEISTASHYELCSNLTLSVPNLFLNFSTSYM
jgi:hypothetical protein